MVEALPVVDVVPVVAAVELGAETDEIVPVASAPIPLDSLDVPALAVAFADDAFAAAKKSSNVLLPVSTALIEPTIPC